MNPSQHFLDDIKKFFKSNSALANLIIINIVVFISVNIINVILWLFIINADPDKLTGISKITYWLAVPSDLGSLLVKPWTLFTYMFVQESFFHLFFNMIVLYFAGKIFTEYLNDKKLINTYIWGGIAGGLFYVVSFNIFPVFQEAVPYSVALGSSASVLAILIAIATLAPDYLVNLIFLGRVKLKHIAIVFVVLDILSINKGNPGGHIAHLGGALWGYVSIILYKKGINDPFGINWYALKNLLKWFKKEPKSTFKKVYTTGRPLSDDEYNKSKSDRQKKIDKILDKISKSGYASLTSEEKEILFKASKKD